MTGRPDLQRRPGVWAVGVARAGTALIDVCAFWLSATTLTDLARRAGIDPLQAWMWPVIVDGMIVVATVAIVALSRHGRRATVYPWALLIAGALVSVTANCMHALVATDSDLPPVLSASVAAVPPLVLLAATHLTVQLGHHLTRAALAPDAAPSSAVEAPQPELTTGSDTRSAILSPHPEADPAVDLAVEPAPPPENPRVPGAAVAAAEAVEADLVAERQGRRASAQPVAEKPRAVAGSDARDRAAVLAAEGLSNRAIASQLGVHPSTVGRWLTAPDLVPDTVDAPEPAPNTEPGGAARTTPHHDPNADGEIPDPIPEEEP